MNARSLRAEGWWAKPNSVWICLIWAVARGLAMIDSNVAQLRYHKVFRWTIFSKMGLGVPHFITLCLAGLRRWRARRAFGGPSFKMRHGRRGARKKLGVTRGRLELSQARCVGLFQLYR